MTYYPTLDEDLKRAKEILAKGRLVREEFPGTDEQWEMLKERFGGHIFGADILATYKLLESFVQEIEKYQNLLARSRIVLAGYEAQHGHFKISFDQVIKDFDHLSLHHLIGGCPHGPNDDDHPCEKCREA